MYLQKYFPDAIISFRLLLVALLLLCNAICRGDDFSYGGGNSITIFPLQNNNIQMVSEKIEIEIDTINKGNRDNWNVEIVLNSKTTARKPQLIWLFRILLMWEIL